MAMLAMHAGLQIIRQRLILKPSNWSLDARALQMSTLTSLIMVHAQDSSMLRPNHAQ